MLYKFEINKIFCEISLPKDSNEQTIILLPGLPEYPRPKELMEELSKKGYHVIYPRYRGTFESHGSFLEKSPTQDILGIVQTILNGKVHEEFYNYSKFKIPHKKIIFIASSFGGSVALELASLTDNFESEFIIGAPVLDYKEHGKMPGESDLNTLKKFLKNGFPYIYRFQDKHFDNLLNGKVIPSAINIKKFNKKITIIHGDKDPTVSFKRVKDFCAKHKEIKFIQIKNGGHLSLNGLKKYNILNKLL